MSHSPMSDRVNDEDPAPGESESRVITIRRSIALACVGIIGLVACTEAENSGVHIDANRDGRRERRDEAAASRWGAPRDPRGRQDDRRRGPRSRPRDKCGTNDRVE